MRRLIKPFALAALTLLVALMAGVATAHAATSPTAWQAVDMTLILDEDPPVLLVAGTLPGDVTLPAAARLPIPVGAQPQWLGEIMGGDPSQDPSLEPSVTKQGTTNVYSFTLTKSRTGQLEALLPNAVTADGSNFRTSITWPAPQDAGEVRLSVRLPKSARIVVPAEGATLVTSDPTANYYTRTFKDVKAGTPVILSVTYSLQSVVGGADGGSRNRTLIPLLIAGLAVAVLALGVVLARSRRAGSSAGVDDEAETDDDDDDDAWGGNDSAAAAHSDAKLSAGEDRATVANQPDAGEPDMDVPQGDEPDAEDGPSAPRRSSPKAIIGVVVAGALLIVGIAAAIDSTAPKAGAEGITKQFSQGEACVVAAIPLKLASGTSPESEAERIFAAVQGVPGIVYGTVRTAESRVDFGYCDSVATEGQIRAALVQAGFTLGANADGGAPAGSIEASATE